jgi:hypothetical protein
VQPRTLLALIVASGGLAVASAPACSSASTAQVPNVSGTYLLSVIDGTNACRIAGITEGSALSGVPLTVSQSSITPQNMTAILGGAPGALLSGVTGTTTLTGTIGSYQATLTPASPDSGTVPTGTLNGCTYTASASLSLNFAGDTVQGTMTYTLVTSGSNCDTLANCQSVQALAGVLMPMSDSGASDSGASGDARASD